MPQLVDFFCANTTESQKVILTGHLIQCVQYSALPEPIKHVLLSKENDFNTFLRELLALSSNTTWQNVGADDLTEPLLSEPLETKAFGKVKKALPVYAWGTISAVTGGTLWNIINHLLGLTYYMGGLKADSVAAWALFGNCNRFSDHPDFSACFSKQETVKGHPSHFPLCCCQRPDCAGFFCLRHPRGDRKDWPGLVVWIKTVKIIKTAEQFIVSSFRGEAQVLCSLICI